MIPAGSFSRLQRLQTALKPRSQRFSTTQGTWLQKPPGGFGEAMKPRHQRSHMVTKPRSGSRSCSVRSQDQEAEAVVYEGCEGKTKPCYCSHEGTFLVERQRLLLSPKPSPKHAHSSSEPIMFSGTMMTAFSLGSSASGTVFC